MKLDSQMCDDYKRLFDAYRQATAEYTQAVATLAAGPLGSNEYSLRWRRCDEARIASEQARIALDSHVAEHGCVERVRTA